jgi:CDP-diacylglycerol--glycerol-3-phosphate 3-phosphatidyltransferase
MASMTPAPLRSDTPAPPRVGKSTQPHVFNFPNQLTLARFVLALVLFVLIHAKLWGWCLLVFCVATVTDYLDGYYARKLGITSTLGRNLDPLVDKVLVGGAYIFLLPLGARDGWLQPWMVTVVVARELIITSLRGFVESLGGHFGADWLGKIKMGLQCAALIAVFVALRCPEWAPSLTSPCYLLRDVLIYGMLASTLLSGLQYLWRASLLYRAVTSQG